VGTLSIFRPVPTLTLIAAVFVLACATAKTPASPGAPPNVSSITPAAGEIGATVTIVGTGFARENNSVKFGRGYIKKLPSSDGTTLRFTVPDGLDLCAPDLLTLCQGAYPPVTPGDYTVSVMTDGETSNSVTFTVKTP
jgi:hypothetical protein